MPALPPTHLRSLHVTWEAVWRYRAWQNEASAAGQYRMSRTPWRQRWSGCLSCACDGWVLFCQTQRRWSTSWRHFLLRRAAYKHKKTHFLTILSSLNRTFFCQCAASRCLRRWPWPSGCRCRRTVCPALLIAHCWWPWASPRAPTAPNCLCNPGRWTEIPEHQDASKWGERPGGTPE